jgi:type IV pilus assembly protein PilA
MSTLFHLSKKGFTLIELMIVMSIIGILASALYPSVTGYFQRAKVVEYQTWASDYIKIANTYNNEV